MEDDKVLTPKEIWQMQLEHQRKIEKELDKLKQSQEAMTPAEPLTEPPQLLHECLIAVVECRVEHTEWTANSFTLEALREGRVFPYTPEGRKAAIIRARRDYVPGWQDDVNKLNEAFNTPGVTMSRSIQDALHIFLNKYTNKQNHD